MLRSVRSKIYSTLLMMLFSCACAASQHTVKMHRVKAGLAGSHTGIANSGTADTGGFLSELEQKIFASSSSGSGKFKKGIDPVELLELGAAYVYQGEFKKSNEVLEEAYRIYNAQEERAVISLSATSTQIAEAVISEGVGDYQLADYEKVFLHSLKAMNYLLQGDSSAARVEIERAYMRQRLIKERSGNELASARADHSRKIARAQSGSSSVDVEEVFNPDKIISRGRLSSSNKKIIRNVRSSYENAFTEVISSVVYGLNGELDNSLPPLRRAVKISDNPFVRRNKVRRENLQEGRVSLVEDNFYLFVMAGYAPEKQRRSLALYNPWTGAINKVSYATPVFQPSAVSRVDLLDLNGNRIDSAPLLARVSALALKDYEEKLPLMAMKAMSRLLVQSIKDYQLRKNIGDLGAFLGSVMNLTMENADLRAWTLLPDKVLFYAGNITASRIIISVKRDGLKETFRTEVPVNPDKKTVVFVRAWDNSARLFYKNF